MKLMNNISKSALHQALLDNGFDYRQSEFLVESIDKNINVELFGNASFSYEKMCALRDGITLGFDMRPFANETSTRQEIRYAIEEHIFSDNHELSTDTINAYLNYLETIGEF